MRLVKDISDGARAVNVPCIGKRHVELNEGTAQDFGQGARTRMFRLADGYADLDGPAFKAYYCDPCAALATKGA